jgi:hypothetical protein
VNADEVFIDGRRIFAGPANPGVPHTRTASADPELHARVSAAIDLAFARVDPAAVYEGPFTGGAGREVVFDSNGQARHGWLLYYAACPRRAHPFRRAEYRRAADEVRAVLTAAEDGLSVVFDDDLGYGPAEDAVAALERFAAQVTR